MKNNIKGFTIVQLVLVLFLSAGAFAVVAELLKQVNVVSVRGREGASLASLQDMFSPMRNRDKMADFINTMRSSTPWFNSCLPNSGSSYSCPTSANIAAFSELQSKAAGRYVFEAEIVDLNGKFVAGTSSSPVYFDDTGSPCTASDCRFVSKGYAIINSTVDPGDVTLASVIIQNPNAHQRGTVWKPRYTYFEIGTFWKTSATNTCLPGQYVSGLDSNHNVICTALPSPTVVVESVTTIAFSATSHLNLAPSSDNRTACFLSAVDDDTSMFQDSDPASSKVLVSGGYKCQVVKGPMYWYGVAPMPSGSVACEATCITYKLQ